MATYDCLLIGHNEIEFNNYYNMLKAMASAGADHVAFTDMKLNHVYHDERAYSGLDILSRFYNEKKAPDERVNFYNGDCLWTAIAYLGTYLAKHGISFDFVNLFHLEKEKLREKLQANEYHLIALTGTMYVFDQNIKEVVSFIRRYSPSATIIAGGPYISKQAEERSPEELKPLFKYLDADIYAYCREGEQTLVNVIRAIKEKRSLLSVNNIAYRKGGEFIVTPKLREINPLSDNVINYAMFGDAYRSGWANVRVSDGCPYACGFCAFPEHGNARYETMTIERIEQEMNAIRENPYITHLFFIDATLNVPRAHFKNMLRMMIRNNYGFKWHCFFRCDQADEEMIWLMKEAGCIGVFLGLEAAHETVLNNMDKGAHKEDFRRAMSWLKAAGIHQMVSVQVGFPGETYETFHDTLAFLEEIKPDFNRIQIWYCDPTTPVWQKREQFGLTGLGYGWAHSTMTAETAVELVVKAYMSLEGSVHVPDPGYNWVAVYAMEKNGMSIERQKLFLRFFAALAKEQMLHPQAREVPTDLWENFKRCGQFDSALSVDEGVLERYSGARYVAAEKFWIKEFSQDVGSLQPEKNWRREVETSTGFSSHKVELGSEWRQKLEERSGSDWKTGLLAAFGAALAEEAGGNVPILLAMDKADPFPIKAEPVSEKGFVAAVKNTANKVAEACDHRMYGLFVLTNPLRMKEYGAVPPPFCAAFKVAANAAHSSLSQIAEYYPSINSQIEISLLVSDAKGGPVVELYFDPNRRSPHKIETIARRIVELVSTI